MRARAGCRSHGATRRRIPRTTTLPGLGPCSSSLPQAPAVVAARGCSQGRRAAGREPHQFAGLLLRGLQKPCGVRSSHPTAEGATPLSCAARVRITISSRNRRPPSPQLMDPRLRGGTRSASPKPFCVDSSTAAARANQWSRSEMRLARPPGLPSTQLPLSRPVEQFRTGHSDPRTAEWEAASKPCWQFMGPGDLRPGACSDAHQSRQSAHRCALYTSSSASTRLLITASERPRSWECAAGPRGGRCSWWRLLLPSP